MKKLALIIACTMIHFIGYAQMKIGNNPTNIHSNANLQLESTSSNQVIVTRDSSKVGIGTLTPAAKLDVLGTVKITDGTQGTGKVLVSDANGLASWQNASTLQAVTKDSTTASNGLTLSGKDVLLGGTLTKATTVTTSAANTIALAGLQSGASSDSILVVNPSTGVVARKSATAIAAGNTTHAILFNSNTKVLTSTVNGVADTTAINLASMDSTTATNGLTLSGKDVQLGGTLTKATTVTTSAANTIALAGLQSGASSDSILVVNPSTGVVARKSATAIAAGNTTHAILFNSNTKVLTSTVNGVADTTAINFASMDSTTATNGLTLSGKDVQLGGTLTKATTITTSAANTIALAGLQSGASSDSILVVNPSTGVVKRLSPSVLGSATEPWYSTSTLKGATSNTENIYQMGKVGINFNNPTEQFEVNGNIYQRGYSYFKKNTGNTSAYIWTDFTSAGDAINYSFNYHNVASADTVFNSGYGTNTFSQNNAGFYFNTSNGINGASPSKNVVTITNVGRVGINTSNPTARLHVIDTTNNMPLRLEGLTSGSVATDSVLVATSTGVVKRVSLTNAVDNSVGAISIFPYSAIPKGYLECNGQAISRTTYSDLFAKIGTTYGTGNGSTTFNLPDLRGEFVRGWDNGRGVDNGRAIGSYQTGSINIVQHVVVPGSQFTLLGLGTTGASASDLGYDMNNINGNYPNARRTVLASPTGITNHYVDNSFLTGTQWGMSRPRNVAMVYAMKVTPSLNFTSGGSSSSTTEPWYSTTTNTGATSNSENVYQMGNVGIKDNNPGSTLSVNGSLGTNFNTVTSSYSIAADDYYVNYEGSSNVSFTLPTGVNSICKCEGRTYIISNPTSYSLTLKPLSGEKISGADSIIVDPKQTISIVNTNLTSGNTWKIINFGTTAKPASTFQIYYTDANGKINNPEYLTASYFNLAGSDLTLIVPSGYTSNKVVLRWDVWGDVNTSTAATGSLRFDVEQTFNSVVSNISSIMMTGWSLSSSGLTRYSAPASIVLSNLSPGNYIFKLRAKRENETGTLISAPNIYGIAAKGDVLVK